MKLSVKYFLLLCIMCLSTIDVCAQNVGKGLIKSPKIKPPRVKPPIKYAQAHANTAMQMSLALLDTKILP